MSKELEAFERIKNITYDRIDLYGIEVFRKDLNIIEAALKELQECREMMRRFNEACVPMILDNETEKKLKALEIIKENCKIYTESSYPLGPAKWWHIYLNMQGYISDKEQKEQFDLLKEVLL